MHTPSPENKKTPLYQEAERHSLPKRLLTESKNDNGLIRTDEPNKAHLRKSKS
jgi:hypothetical protein